MARKIRQFSEEAMRRVNRAVSAFERGDRNTPGVPLPPAWGDDEPLRLGTVSATWTKGTDATVTQLAGDGSAISPTVTFTAKNWFATVTVASGTKKVACGLVGDVWILIAAEC